MARWIITALGQDRPGIVAGVTQTLYRLGCNLEDSAMTRLEDEFTIMLIFSGPARITAEKIRRAFAALERRLKLAVHLKPLTARETRVPRPRGAAYHLSVYGADRSGIVFQVSQALARGGVNITDVHTHRSAEGKPLYLMLLELEIPPRLSVSSLEQRLHRLAKRLGVEVSLRAADANVL